MAEVKRYVTPIFRASFVNVFEARSMEEGQKKKYGITAIWTPKDFTEGDKKRWKAILTALNEASQAKFKCAWKDLPANIKRGIRNGNEKADLEGFGEGTRFANVTSQMRPGIVDLSKDPIGPEHGNEDKIYSGCYCRATVTVYTYDNKGKGVALGLQNLQVIKDGPRLDARTDAAEDFEDDVDEAWLEDEGGDGDGDDDFLE